MFQSPFLDANPSYASLLTSAEPHRSIWLDGEYYMLWQPWSPRAKAYESPIYQFNKTGKIDFSSVPRPRVGYSRPSYIYLIFITIYRRKWYRSFYRILLPPKEEGGSMRNYGSQMKSHRRDSRSKIYLPPGKYNPKGPRSPNVRPNPEIRSKFRQNFSEGNNGGYFFSPSLSSEVTYTRTWSGQRTPGFGGLKRNQRPVNPHSVSITDVNDSGLIEMLDIPSSGVYFNQYSAWTRRYNPPAVLGHNSLALTKAIKKLVNRMEVEMNSNLAQDIVQIKQTISLIADTAKRLAKSGLALKNGNFPGAAKALFGSSRNRYDRKRSRQPDNTKSLADNWLAMQYGWKPLLQDLHGAMEAAAKLHLADASVKQATASALVENWVVEDLPLAFNSAKVGGWIRTQRTTRCKLGVKFTVDNHLVSFLAQTGFTNPINLLWEVIPFSFVWDWMQPIGPWLESLSSFHGLVFFDGYQTLFTREVTESSVRFAGEIGPPAPGQNLQTAGTYGREVVLLDRTKLNSFPSATFPSFKNPLSVTHALNALALVKSVFHK